MIKHREASGELAYGEVHVWERKQLSRLTCI